MTSDRYRSTGDGSADPSITKATVCADPRVGHPRTLTAPVPNAHRLAPGQFTS